MSRWKRPTPPTTQQALLFVFILVAISLGTWINGQFPKPQAVLDRPYVTQAQVRGESARVGDIEITDLRTYSLYRDEPTQGIFLAVELTPHAVPEILTLDALLIDGAGREVARHYSAACALQQVGLTSPCTFAFEMDPEALAGSHLLVAQTSVLTDRDHLDFDLLIDDARAAELLADPHRSDYFGEEL